MCSPRVSCVKTNGSYSYRTDDSYGGIKGILTVVFVVFEYAIVFKEDTLKKELFDQPSSN